MGNARKLEEKAESSCGRVLIKMRSSVRRSVQIKCVNEV